MWWQSLRLVRNSSLLVRTTTNRTRSLEGNYFQRGSSWVFYNVTVVSDSLCCLSVWLNDRLGIWPILEAVCLDHSREMCKRLWNQASAEKDHPIPSSNPGKLLMDIRGIQLYWISSNAGINSLHQLFLFPKKQTVLETLLLCLSTEKNKNWYFIKSDIYTSTSEGQHNTKSDTCRNPL